MERIFIFLNEIGSAVCHRLPERSFFWDGRQMPLCARCTGLYTGVFFSFCFFLWKRRQHGDAPFSALLTVLALLPLAADGFGSYIGLWESSQSLRVLTGAAAGAAMPALFLLAGNFDPKQKPRQAIYTNRAELPCLLACSLAWGLLLRLGAPLFAIGAVFSAAGVVCFWAGILFLLLRAAFPAKNLPFWRISAIAAFCILWFIGKMLYRQNIGTSLF